ncbi:pantoate--beta-alanine ligase [Sporolactobacillus sp. KGMB 08714]|uniref:pantoate--beta-alanine ligase n=1 Tax=unclassified Sporolactobacillus TaxID=2628533 RepID=UPI003FA77B47
MVCIKSPEDMARFVSDRKKAGKTVGFVPTMGFLHEGHLSLFRKAAETSDCVVASVFVNPTQFGDREDYINYPQDTERDARLAEEAGVEALFLPDVSAVYPNGTAVTVTVHEKTDVLCGKSRPGHFDGVATVLTKLFNIVQPDTVYFGMKDAQQVAVVGSLIRAFHFPIKLIPCPIIREADGLARSSRNVRLNADERKEAVELSRGLQQGMKALKQGERDFEKIAEAVRLYYRDHLKLAEIDYVDVLNYPDLKRNGVVLSGPFIIASAVRYSRARLIDNVTGNTAALKEEV